MQHQTTTEGIAAELAAATKAAQMAQEAYQAAALASIEGLAKPKELESAAAAVQRADQHVAQLKAAKAAHEARLKRDAEAAQQAAAAAQAAQLAQLTEQAREAARAWDDQVAKLVTATANFDAAVRAVYMATPSPEAVRKFEGARESIMQIIGYRLAAFVGDGHRPPYFPEVYSRLTYHIPKAAE